MPLLLNASMKITIDLRNIGLIHINDSLTFRLKSEAGQCSVLW